MGARGARRLAGGLAALALAIFLAVWLGVLAGEIERDSGELPFEIFLVAFALVFGGVGALIATRQPGNAIGWLFLGTGLATALAELAAGYADRWVAGEGGSDALGETAATYAENSWVPFVLVPAIFLVLLFPSGTLLSGRWRPIAWIAGLGIGGVFVTGVMTPGKLEDYPQLENAYGVEGPLLDAFTGLAFLAVLVGLVGASASLILRYRHSDGEERLQIKWLALAGAVAAVTFPLALAGMEVWESDVWNFVIMLSVLALPVAAGVAILRYRLYEIDVVINRALVYATLTTFLAAAFAAITLLGGVILGGGSTVPTAAATLAVALAFRPLRSGVQSTVDRRLNPERYQGLRSVDEFLAKLRAGQADPEAVGSVLSGAVSDSSLRLYFRIPDEDAHADERGRVVAELPTEPAGRTPVRRGSFELATLVHDPRLAERPGLLDAVIVRAGLAIEIARLRVEVRHRLAEVEDSRARIVTAAHEERRRLERDLHDGAQQRLVSIGLELRHLQGSLGDDEPARAGLDSVVIGLSDAIAELRELASGIRPAALEAGLGPALRELASRAPIETDVEAAAERFRDEVEAAAYFVAAEGLTNAVKHAGGSRVRLTAARRNGNLVVSVTDNGRGGATTEGGSGLTGLADRVAALGGRLDVQSTAGRGTTLTAELPCE